jgi:hypothetical protein
MKEFYQFNMMDKEKLYVMMDLTISVLKQLALNYMDHQLCYNIVKDINVITKHFG